MASPIDGKKLHAFFQDPHFWGCGQSFRNLKLLVDGREIGEIDFQAGWDPRDIQMESLVEIIAGTWDGRGHELPDTSMSGVLQLWLLGVKPTPPAPPVLIGGLLVDPCPMLNDALVMESPPTPLVQRPSFLLTKKPASLDVAQATIKRPAFSF